MEQVRFNSIQKKYLNAKAGAESSAPARPNEIKFNAIQKKYLGPVPKSESSAPQPVTYAGTAMPTEDELYAGALEHQNREAAFEEANKGFWRNLWDSASMGVTMDQMAGEGFAPGMTEQAAKLAAQQMEAAKNVQTYRQQIKELNAPTEWTGREAMIDEYRALQRGMNADMAATDFNGGVLPEDYAEREARMRELLREIELRDTAAGNGVRSYSGQDRIANVVGGTGQSIASGLINAGATAFETMARSQNAMWAADPNAYVTPAAETPEISEEELHESLKPLYDAADRIGEGAAQSLETAKNGLSSLGRAGVDIAQNMMEMGFDAAVGSITGGGSLASMFARVYGQGTMEARQAGATLDQQNAYGFTTAAIEAFTEKMADGVAGIYGKGAADEITEKLIGKLTESDLGRSLLRLLIGGVSEGTEEVVSDLLSPLAEALYKTDSEGNRLIVSQLYDQRFSADGRAEMLKDFLLGAAVGLIAGGGNFVNGGNAQANAELRMADAGIGSVENQTDAAWDVLTGRVPPEQSRAQQANALQRLGLTESEIRTYQDTGVLPDRENAAGRRTVAAAVFTAEDGTGTVMPLDEALTGDRAELPENLATTMRQMRSLGEDAAGTFAVYDGSMSAGSYAAAMRDAIHVYAANGADLKTVAARLRSQGRTGGVAALTDAQLTYAQQAGEKLHNAEKTAAEGRSESLAKKPRKPRGRTGKVYTRGAVDARGNRLKGIDEKNLSREQKDVVGVVGRLSRVMPLNYVVYDGDARGTQGYFEASTGTVYVNINAGGGMTVAALGTLTHEITHELQAHAPAQYQALQDEITKIYFENDPALFADRVHKWMQEGGDTALSEAEATDEVIANSCMRMLGDTDAIAQVMADDETLARKILSTIKSRINAILSKMKAIYAEDRFYLQHKAEFEKARQLWADAFAAAAENAQRDGTETGQMQNMAWDEQTLQEHEVITAVYDVLDHKDAGDDNLVKVGRMPSFIRDLAGIDGDFYLYRNHAYENIRTKKEAIAENRYDKGAHYHGVGEEKFVDAIMSLNSPAITINDSDGRGNPQIVMVLPVLGESGTPLIAAIGFYVNKPINGKLGIRPHITLSVYEKLEGETNERGMPYKDLGAFVDDAAKNGNIISYDKKISDSLPVIAQRSGLGNVTELSLKKNVAQFQKEVNDFRANHRIFYQLLPVDEVQPSGDAWKRTATTEEAMQAYPNLWNVAAEESETRKPTQIASTQGTYRKIYNILKNSGFTGRILDASSGLGLGTQVGRNEFGFDVDDIEPYPGENFKPRYTDYSTLNEKYDAIINDQNILYLNEDKKRTRDWFQVCDISVPLNGTKFGLIRSIQYVDKKSNRQKQSWDSMNETEQKQEIRKNKSFNAAQTETGSPLKTLKGSDISRHLYRDYLERARRNPRLAAAQVTRPLTEPELPADNTAAAVAEYVQRKNGTDAAVEYIAEEVAARHLYSDEAETILRRLRTGA